VTATLDEHEYFCNENGFEIVDIICFKFVEDVLSHMVYVSKIYA